MRQILMSAALAACLLTGPPVVAQTPTVTIQGFEPPPSRSRSLRSTVEWGGPLSKLRSSSEEWWCEASGGRPEQTLKFEITLTRPTVRVYLNGRELDAAPINEEMKLVNAHDVVRIDVEECATDPSPTDLLLSKGPHVIILKSMALGTLPAEPIAAFSITPEGVIKLLKLY